MHIDLIRKIEWPVLALTYLLAVIALLLLMSNIKGPFIFGDELLYHQLSQAIYENFEFSGRQYNPLYPLLLSPTFVFSEPSLHYFAIKFVNAITWCSIIFPSYLLARKIIIDRKVAYLLALLSVVTPIGAYSQMIWAEPLYYPLICWSLYFIYRWLDGNKLQDGVLAGIAIGLSFLTKQVGILLVFALYAAWFFHFISKRERMKLQPSFWIIGAIPMFIAFMWWIRNKMAEGGSFGYSGAIDILINSAKHPIQYLASLMHALSYPIGYSFASYFGFGFILLLLATLQNRESSESEQKVVLLARVVVIFSVLVAVITDVFLIGYGKDHFSVGRYIDAMYPVAIIIIAWQAMRTSIITSKNVFFLIAGISIVTFFASPLEQLSAESMVSASGISYLNGLFSRGAFLWSEVPVDILSKGCLSIGLLLTSLIVFVKNWKVKITLACLFCLIIGGFGHYCIIKVGESGNQFNSIIKEVARKGIDPQDIAFDNALKGSNMPFHYNFWLSKHGCLSEVNFTEPSVLIETYKISFGVKDANSVEKYTMKVWAPWNPKSGYNPQYGIGFADISSINAGKCQLPKERARSLNQKSHVKEFIFSKNKAEYKINLAPGRYRATGLSADARCFGAEKTGYSVFISGSTHKGFVVRDEKEWNLDFIVTKEDPVAKITFAPFDGSIWSLYNIKIRNLVRTHNDLYGHTKYFVSHKLLPREIIVESNGMYLYKI